MPIACHLPSSLSSSDEQVDSSATERTSCLLAENSSIIESGATLLLEAALAEAPFSDLFSRVPVLPRLV